VAQLAPRIRISGGRFGSCAGACVASSRFGKIHTNSFDLMREAEQCKRIESEEACMVRIVIAVMLLALPAAARDLGQWEGQPSSVRQWFQRLMQPDNPYLSCCGEADAFEADNFEIAGDQYVAIVTDGKGIIPDGTRIPVPNQKVKWDDGNPTGHGIIFIGPAGQVYCYVTPGGV
jgi:hypothetical protein